MSNFEENYEAVQKLVGELSDKIGTLGLNDIAEDELKQDCQNIKDWTESMKFAYDEDLAELENERDNFEQDANQLQLELDNV